MANVTESETLIRKNLQQRLDDTTAMLEHECVSQAATLAERITGALRSGNKVLFFGNGGSSMDAGHLAAELLGRFYYDRPSLPSVSLPDATASMTAIGNDYGYDEVFARQVRGLGVAGDVAVGLTTSGNSPNVVAALEAAREMSIFTAVLTGAKGGAAADVADIAICVPTTDTPRVQEACLHLGHTVCELVEAAMFPRPETTR